MSEELDRRHPVTLAVVLAMVAIAIVGTLYMMRRADARVTAMDGSDQSASVPVDVYILQPVEIPRTVTARGFLSGVEEVTVHAEVAGRIVSRTVAEGDPVTQGDILLNIDDTFYALAVRGADAEQKRAEAQLGEARAAVDQAQAQVQAVQAILANAAQELERVSELYAADNAPEIEFNRTVLAHRTAQADTEAAQAALSRARDQKLLVEATLEATQVAREEAQARLANCVLRAPCSGRVNRYFVETGEYAVMTAPLVEIVRLDQMKMNVELADTKIRLLDEFSHADVTADAIGQSVHKGRLHHVAPKMDPISRKFQVELLVDNEDESLLSGMYGVAVLYAGDWTGVLRLPRRAVFKHYGADHCLVVRDEQGVDRARLQQVQVRDIPGRLDEVEVVDGLEPGQRIVVSRRRELRDGVLVEVGRTTTASGELAAGKP